jgi:hypothetical protein
LLDGEDGLGVVGAVRSATTIIAVMIVAQMAGLTWLGLAQLLGPIAQGLLGSPTAEGSCASRRPAKKGVGP